MTTGYEIFERETDSANLAEYYGRTYSKNTFASQKCGANAMFYYGNNGEDAEGFEELNEMYWGIKNAGGVTINSGFRVWADQSKTETQWE